MSGPPREDLPRILDAVATMETSLERLVEKRGAVNRETYLEDPDVRDIVERRFVKLTEAAIEIGTVIVRAEQGAPPESNPQTMHALVEVGILDDQLGKEMAAAARFRNVLAHTYGDSIDHHVVYDALSDLDRYRSYLIAIRDHLESSGAL